MILCFYLVLGISAANQLGLVSLKLVPSHQLHSRVRLHPGVPFLLPTMQDPTWDHLNSESWRQADCSSTWSHRCFSLFLFAIHSTIISSFSWRLFGTSCNLFLLLLLDHHRANIPRVTLADSAPLFSMDLLLCLRLASLLVLIFRSRRAT